MEPRLDIQHLSRVLGTRCVVDDVSLSVREGEIACLLGPSGCGKSTTLRTISGIERADKGSILINGRVVAEGGFHLPPEAREVGFMFQDLALFPHLSVAQNVGFGIPSQKRRARVQEALRRVDMAGFAHAYPHELSGGEQRRVALARAMAPSPQVMLMDEPFSGLHERLRDEVRDATLAILREQGVGVIMVTHEPDEALLMADRIALMRAGKVVQTGSPQEMYDAPVDLEAASFFSQINVLAGRIAGGVAATALGPIPAPGYADGETVDIAIRPQHLALCETGAPARVVRVRYLGLGYRVVLALEEHEQTLCLTTQSAHGMRSGDPVRVQASPDGVMVFHVRSSSDLS